MQPDKAAQYQPKWRHFHTQDVVFVKNPFEFSIFFKVADEHNQQWEYEMPAGKISELPGGMIATLGLKQIVDRLIGQHKEDAIRIWEPSVRKKYEDQVIVKVKLAPNTAANTPSGPVDLSASAEEDDTEQVAESQSLESSGIEEQQPKAKAETAFPAKARGRSARDNDSMKRENLKGLAAASISDKDQIIDED